MKILKLSSIYVGIIIIIFCLLFSTSGILREGWIIYVNQEYDNVEKLNYKLEKKNIRYIKQEKIEEILKNNNIILPKDSIIQKLTCTETMRSDRYNIIIWYIDKEKEQTNSKSNENEISTYIINNGYKYKDNTFRKLKISIAIILTYAIIEVVIIIVCKKLKIFSRKEQIIRYVR